MKLLIHCPACFEEFGPLQVPHGEQNGLANLAVATPYIVQVREDFTYTVECLVHGEQISVLATPRFEILFQIGLNAVLDGYSRDAVTSFYSSMEHFFEYYLAVIATKNGIEGGAFKKGWNAVKVQSERQLGAFIIVHVCENGRAPHIPDRIEISRNMTLTSFRNKVVHQGRIPTIDEAIRFGDGVLSIISPVLAQLRNSHPEEVAKVDDHYFQSALRNLPARDGPIGRASFHPAFGPAYNVRRLDEAINDKLDLMRMTMTGIPEMHEALRKLLGQ